MNTVLNGVSCFIAYMRYHGIMSYSEVKMTDAHFIATISMADINNYRNIFTNVERVAVSKKHVTAKNLYKVYLQREGLVKDVNMKCRKDGSPDMRYKKDNMLAVKQVKVNAFFRTTV